MLTVQTTGTNRIQGELDRKLDETLVKQKRVIEFYADRLANLARQTVYQTTKGTGSLAQSILAEPATMQGDEIKADVVWGVAHGPLMEYGPDIQQWTIRATYAKALRWIANGSVHYAKQVLHTWDRSQLRPHMEPAADEIAEPLANDLAETMVW